MSSGKNTAYRVEFTARAILDLDSIYESIDAPNSAAAHRWYNGLETLILTLEHLPERGAVTPEDAMVRQLLYGNKPHIYRILYRINGDSVSIVHIRHGARRPFRKRALQ